MLNLLLAVKPRLHHLPPHTMLPTQLDSALLPLPRGHIPRLLRPAGFLLRSHPPISRQMADTSTQTTIEIERTGGGGTGIETEMETAITTAMVMAMTAKAEMVSAETDRIASKSGSRRLRTKTRCHRTPAQLGGSR